MRALTRITTAMLAVALAVAAAPASGTSPGDVTAVVPERSWPLEGQPLLVNEFRPPPRDWLSGHRGVDLSASVGERVIAPVSGTVSFAGLVVDRPVLVISAGELLVSLEPVAAEVDVGSGVVAGQRVGRIADGPSHCAPSVCLHWGLRVAGEYRNPLLLVLRGRPVLVPPPAGSAAIALR